MKKYKFKQVGIKRHPELYLEKEKLLSKVFGTVGKELEMWKAAEKLNKILNRYKFSNEQLFYIWHFVLCLRDIDNIEELRLYEWVKFRLYLSRILDRVYGTDKKAKRLAREYERKN